MKTPELDQLEAEVRVRLQSALRRGRGRLAGCVRHRPVTMLGGSAVGGVGIGWLLGLLASRGHGFATRTTSIVSRVAIARAIRAGTERMQDGLAALGAMSEDAG